MIKRFLRKHLIYFHGNLLRSNSGRCVAFADEFPDVTAEGENADEAKENLKIALKEYIEYKKAELLESVESTGHNKPLEHFKLQLA